jgi:Arc/MetJ-type ribon-helix-helix transcriptional regulator
MIISTFTMAPSEYDAMFELIGPEGLYTTKTELIRRAVRELIDQEIP